MPRLWIAVLFGMIGVIAIIKPTGVLFFPVTLLPVLTAILYSVYEVLTKISTTESPYTSLFYSAMVGALISSLVLPLTWQPPNLEQSFSPYFSFSSRITCPLFFNFVTESMHQYRQFSPITISR